ncbi:MAG: hydrogenase maturation protease [Nitrosomonadales bacterium]|nr:hydrogenase maturation protease [Nitrosomonadales bacterium]
MAAPVLIFAVGNESRGDDALAPLLLRRLDAWLQKEGRSADFELIEDFQLQVEHAMDMAGRRLVLFIDAGMDTPEPYAFYRALAGDTSTPYSHALAPEAVLAVYPQIYREAPPPAFILCIRGEQFELGSPLSPAAASRLDSAMNFMHKLLQGTEAAAWEMRVQQQAYGDAEKHEACTAQ